MKILIVDDHPLIQEALAQVLQNLDRQIEIFASHDREQTIEQIAGHDRFDLVLLDLDVPGVTGFSLLRELRELYPEIPIVVLSGKQDRDTVLGAIDLGAMGFIPKTSNSKVLLSALQVVLSGSVYLPAEIIAGSAPVQTKADPSGLTPRQLDVLALLVQGMPNKLICRELNLSEGTVKVHISAILKTLNVANRTQVVIALSHSGIQLPIMQGRKR